MIWTSTPSANLSDVKCTRSPRTPHRSPLSSSSVPTTGHSHHRTSAVRMRSCATSAIHTTPRSMAWAASTVRCYKTGVTSTRTRASRCCRRTRSYICSCAHFPSHFSLWTLASPVRHAMNGPSRIYMARLASPHLSSSHTTPAPALAFAWTVRTSHLLPLTCSPAFSPRISASPPPASLTCQRSSHIALLTALPATANTTPAPCDGPLDAPAGPAIRYNRSLPHYCPFLHASPVARLS